MAALSTGIPAQAAPASQPTTRAATTEPTLDAAIRRMPPSSRHQGPGGWSQDEMTKAGNWLYERLTGQQLIVVSTRVWHEGGPQRRATVTLPPVLLWGMSWRAEATCFLAPEADALLATLEKDAKVRLDGWISGVSKKFKEETVELQLTLRDVKASVAR